MGASFFVVCRANAEFLLTWRHKIVSGVGTLAWTGGWCVVLAALRVIPRQFARSR